MAKPKKLQYNGDSKVVKYVANCVNWLLDNLASVVANPEDTATSTLSKIEIDGEVYDIQGGGGGGGVIPNPPGTPTDVLNSIGIQHTQTIKYLDNGLIGATGGSYITCNLDRNLDIGDYTFRMVDDSYVYDGEFSYNGSDVTISMTGGGNSYVLNITSTTAGLTYYTGAWRNIYCDISLNVVDTTIYSIGGGTSLPFEFVINSQDYGIDILYNGSPVFNIAKVFDDINFGSTSYQAEQSGVYLIINSFSSNASHSITLPQGVTPIIDRNIGRDRGMQIVIAELNRFDVVRISANPSEWNAFSKAVYLLDGFTTFQFDDATFTSDGQATYTPPQDDDYYLMLGVAMGKYDNPSYYRNDTDTSSSDCEIVVEENIGVNTILGMYYGVGNNLPMANFYGYDGGCVCIINILTNGGE